MKITISKLVEINSLDQWLKVAPPKGESSQLKEGRSAIELARFALSDKFSKIILKVLEECGLPEDSFVCEPEAKTPFPKGMGSGGPRNHDLLMKGNNTIIGIEAKVSEPFDKKIKDKRNNASNNMNNRLDSCLDFIYQTRPCNAEELYYQLFSATIGTILEAKKNGISNAVSLFITFVGNVSKEKDYDNHIKENNKAFINFCNTFDLDENGGKLPSIPEAPDINCWVKKIVIRIGDYKKE